LLIFDERHLRRVLNQYVDHYNRQRPHLALDLRPPIAEFAAGSGPIVRHSRLYGMINVYSRAA
jgi:putative transposase